MTPTPTPPPDAAQTVAAAYQVLLTAEADQAVAYETYMRVPLADSRPTCLAYDRAILGRHKAQDALYAACAALLTPAQVAYRAYVAALVEADLAHRAWSGHRRGFIVHGPIWERTLAAQQVAGAAYAAWRTVEAAL